MTHDAGPPATRRILAAARTLVARGGTAEISMGDVADEAGVSKALIHYHFKDKDSLLASLAEDVGASVVARTRGAQRSLEDASGHVLDAYWTWFDGELRSGDVGILLALAQSASERVRAESRRIADQRRALAAAQTAEIFTRLGLSPRIPPELLAETVTVFTDGLAAAHALSPERDPRPAFDVLWLALLTLAE